MSLRRSHRTYNNDGPELGPSPSPCPSRLYVLNSYPNLLRLLSSLSCKETIIMSTSTTQPRRQQNLWKFVSHSNKINFFIRLTFFSFCLWYDLGATVVSRRRRNRCRPRTKSRYRNPCRRAAVCHHRHHIALSLVCVFPVPLVRAFLRHLSKSKIVWQIEALTGCCC